MGLTGGKGGGKNALAAKPNLLNALRVQTSSYGQVIPILYGQNRISGRLLWSGDFQAIAHTSTQKVGGKGLGSGGGNVAQTSYTYQTAVAIALCMGPIQNMGSVWDTKGKLTLLSTSVPFTVPGGGGSFTPPIPGGGVWHSGRGVSRLEAFSVNTGPNGDFGSDGSITLTGNQNRPMVLVGSSPGAGQYMLNTSTGQHTFSSADAGKVMTIMFAYSVPDSSSNGQPQTKLNLTLFLGQKPQTPWSYLTSAHPGQDLGYNSIAYLASSALDLGSSGALPNLSYEILGLLPFGGGITDAEPSAIISDLAGNAVYGLNGIITIDPTTLAAFKNFCLTHGIFLSPVLDAQKSAAQWIQEILDITNASAVWSEGVLKIISYGDTTAVGNGAVFTPNTTPIYDLSSNDFLDVVKVKRPSVADVMNSVSVEFVNRANDYNVEVAEDKDEASIALYGLRKAQPTQSHHITTSSVAKFVANLLRKREIEIRATYTLKLGWQFNLLEPMDLVTITVPELGYAKKPVRITAIREDDTGELEIDAEDFPWGTATPTLYAQQTPSGFVPNIAADPGSVNAPIVFEAPPNLSKSGQHEIWMAVSGASPNWGGCSVWVSQDNTEYHQVGRINAPARMGVLGGSGVFGITGDPYTGGVGQTFDLSQSKGILIAGTQADADSYRTLVYFDGEFIAYRDMTLVSANVYNPQGYIRRGLFGSNITTHNLGSPVARLDDAIFTYIYDPAFIGKTIYLKFTSFNTNGMVEQSIASATAYQFIVTGKFCQMETVSKNLLANPGFESNQVLTPVNSLFTTVQRASDNWTANQLFVQNLGKIAIYYTDGTGTGGVTPRSGSRFMMFSMFPNGMANGAVANSSVVSDRVPVSPGESYSFGGYVRLDTFGISGVNSSLTVRLFTFIGLFDASGAYLGDSVDGSFPATGSQGFNGSNPPSGWQRGSSYFTVPAMVSGNKPAFMSLVCYVEMDNVSGGTFSTAGSIEVSFDDMFLFPQWSPLGDEIAKTGSLSVTYTGGLTYTSTTNSITWSWNINASRTDLPMSVNNYNSSQTVSGLSASTSYNFYPFIDEVNSVVSMVATGGTGSPSWAHSGTNIAWTQEQARSDHWPLSSAPMVAATTTSGSGGGGGGGVGGSCLRHDVRVREKNRGVIAVDELQAGDFVHCPIAADTPEGWAEVIEIDKDFRNQEWVHIHFGNGEWLATTPGHPFTLEDEAGAPIMKRAARLSLEDAIPCVTGITFPGSIAVHRYDDAKVRVTIRSAAHTFYAGMNEPTILQHNFQVLVS